MRFKVVLFLVIILGLSCGKDKDFVDLLIVPEATTLLFPENLTQCLEGSILSSTQSEVTFRWSISENTDFYELYLTNLLTGTTDIYSTANNELPLLLGRGVPYSWYVLSLSDNDSQSASSATWSFYNAGEGLLTHIPFPAEIISPEDFALIATGNTSLILNWQGNDLDNDISDFDIHFGTNPDPSLFSTGVAESSLNVNITSGTSYYWRVITRDTEGNESSSKINTFTVQ